MGSEEDIKQQQELLVTYRRTLYALLKQRAQISAGHVPAHIVNGIDEARDHIRQLKHNLQDMGAPADSKNYDEEPQRSHRTLTERLFSGSANTGNSHNIGLYIGIAVLLVALGAVSYSLIQSKRGVITPPASASGRTPTVQTPVPPAATQVPPSAIPTNTQMPATITPANTTALDEIAVKQLVEREVRAANARDLVTLDSLYIDDSLIINREFTPKDTTDDKIYNGKQGVNQFYQDFYSISSWTEYSIKNLRVVVDGDTAIGTHEGTTIDGVYTKDAATYRFKKIDGVWYIISLEVCTIQL